jgi:lipopolysaccharide export system protein LptA
VTTLPERHLRRALRRLPGPRAALLVAAVALASSATHAERADREKPINYSADTGDVNYQTKVGSLSGNVIITQGTMTIRADRIVFRQNADNSLSATAYGNPVSFRQKRDGYDEYFEGYAQRAEYDGTREHLELFDRALLKRGQDEIRSNYVSYNAATEVFRAEGRAASAPTPDPEGPGARVRGVFQPKSETPLPGRSRDAGKAPAKEGTSAPEAPPAALKSTGELKPPAAK